MAVTREAWREEGHSRSEWVLLSQALTKVVYSAGFLVRLRQADRQTAGLGGPNEPAPIERDSPLQWKGAVSRRKMGHGPTRSTGDLQYAFMIGKL